MSCEAEPSLPNGVIDPIVRGEAFAFLVGVTDEVGGALLAIWTGADVQGRIDWTDDTPSPTVLGVSVSSSTQLLVELDSATTGALADGLTGTLTVWGRPTGEEPILVLVADAATITAGYIPVWP